MPWRRLLGDSEGAAYLGVLRASLSAPHLARDLRLPGYRAYVAALEDQLDRVMAGESLPGGRPSRGRAILGGAHRSARPQRPSVATTGRPWVGRWTGNETDRCQAPLAADPRFRAGSALLAASATALIALLEIRDEVSGVTEQALPASGAALVLARVGERLQDRTPALMAAKGTDARRRQTDLIKTDLLLLASETERLRQLQPGGSGGVEDIARLAPELAATCATWPVC